MEKHIFKPPIKLWTAKKSDKIINNVNEATKIRKGEILFDLSDVKFFHPFGLNMLAGSILFCLNKGLKCKWKEPVDKRTRKFLESIEFNKLFKLHDLSVNGWKGLASQVQLQWMTQKDTYMAGRIVDVFGRHLRMTEAVKDSLVMSLTELMNNAFDHSESEIGCLVCAQAYPLRQEIRACLMDFGIGIKKSLEKNPELKKSFTNEIGAIQLAFEEGISSVEGSRGLGLTRIEDFLKANEGELIIISGGVYLRRSHFISRENIVIRKNEFQGTAIEIVVRADKEGLYAFKDETDYLF